MIRDLQANQVDDELPSLNQVDDAEQRDDTEGGGEGQSFSTDERKQTSKWNANAEKSSFVRHVTVSSRHLATTICSFPLRRVLVLNIRITMLSDCAVLLYLSYK